MRRWHGDDHVAVATRKVERNVQLARAILVTYCGSISHLAGAPVVQLVARFQQLLAFILCCVEVLLLYLIYILPQSQLERKEKEKEKDNGHFRFGLVENNATYMMILAKFPSCLCKGLTGPHLGSPSSHLCLSLFLLNLKAITCLNNQLDKCWHG